MAPRPMLRYSQYANRCDSVVRDVEEVVATGRTRFQHYLFFRSAVHGVCVVLDGDVQSCEADEGIYHEALVHPALLLHPRARHVLIMGGGEGATAREVLRHARVRAAAMVDIDAEFVELCRKHLPTWSAGVYDDPRLSLRCEDINDYLAEEGEPFDVVIGDLVDVNDWDSPAGALYRRDFFQRLKACMAPDAILAAQAGPLGARDADSHCRVRAELASCFENVVTYALVVPSFYHLWSFVLASDAALVSEPQALRGVLARAVEAQRLELPCTGSEVLASAFSLPRQIASRIAR